MENKTSENLKAVNAFARAWNPLRGLTQSGIDSFLEQIRHGNDVRLQVAFYEMERTTPIFGVCINKRLAGITDRQWDIIPVDSSAKAKAQAEAVKRIFLKSDTRNLDGLTEAMRQLGMASFRGRACVKPFFDENGDLYFKKVQAWNTLEWNDKLYWNPEASQMVFFGENDNCNLQLLSDDEVCWIKEERPIDIPGLQVYLRQLVGEQNWARATEKYGVAQCIITAPEGTPENVLDAWNSRAIAIFEGGSGVLPAGAQVNTLTDARGQDPFSTFVEHQQEVIVLLALGEKLTTLGGSTGLGSNLADVQSKEFDNLVNYDCKRIANVFTRCAVKKCVEHLGQKDVLCRFQFVESDNTDPEKYLAMAKAVQDMGLDIDVEALKKVTGLQFIKDGQADIWKPKTPEDLDK